MALQNLARFNRLVMPLAVAAGLGLAGIQLVGSSSRAQTSEATVMVSPGDKGAQMYCFMRASGNSHQVSWDAAYALIKRQSDKWFKTSPEHASVMIAEAVVQNPGKFPDCGRYLGDLFVKAEPKPETKTTPPANGGTPATNRSGTSTGAGSQGP